MGDGTKYFIIIIQFRVRNLVPTFIINTRIDLICIRIFLFVQLSDAINKASVVVLRVV